MRGACGFFLGSVRQSKIVESRVLGITNVRALETLGEITRGRPSLSELDFSTLCGVCQTLLLQLEEQHNTQCTAYIALCDLHKLSATRSCTEPPAAFPASV